MNMKKFEVDCNFNYLGPDMPSLSKKEVITFNLNTNDRVVVYQDDDEWVGTVVFDDKLPLMYQWYVRLD
ncbi:hypothetical protein WAK64_21975 [Bacillus spongiae]|uniref:DUF5348 domain-containing protein n=1 Tax=Bacillus spongiae TaxID=2683610 RepID=A0ABU8HK84_9BACI